MVRTEFSIPRGGFYNDMHRGVHPPLHNHYVEYPLVAQYGYSDQQEEKGNT